MSLLVQLRRNAAGILALCGVCLVVFQLLHWNAAVGTTGGGHDAGLVHWSGRNKPPVVVKFLSESTGHSAIDAGADILEHDVDTAIALAVEPADCMRRWMWGNALDDKVWDSSVASSDNQEPPSDVDDGHRAYVSGCKLTDVFVDGVTVYLMPKPGMEVKAAKDLFDCCLARGKGDDPDWVHEEEGVGTRCAGSSVGPAVCDCFPKQTKYAPSVWLGGRGGQNGQAKHQHTVRAHIRERSWLMHHNGFMHHPDNFNQKVLEWHGLYTTRCAT